MKEMEEQIAEHQELNRAAKQRRDNEDEDLDEFMSHLSAEKNLDKTVIKKLRVSNPFNSSNQSDCLLPFNLSLLCSLSCNGWLGN